MQAVGSRPISVEIGSIYSLEISTAYNKKEVYDPIPFFVRRSEAI